MYGELYKLHLKSVSKVNADFFIITLGCLTKLCFKNIQVKSGEPQNSVFRMLDGDG